jgi:hypothetical protein
MSDGDLTVHQAIVEVINELGGIDKSGYNREQGYNFRGIDAVLQHLHPLFAKYGIFIAPQVVQRIYEERISSKGTVGHACHLRVNFTVYGPTGDFITLVTWGEAVDYSDKATNKAMTAAFKYALFQLFAICDPLEDADGSGNEGGKEVEGAGSEGDGLTRLDFLVDLLLNSGFTKAIQADIIAAAVGHHVQNVGQLSAEEIELSIRGIEGAIADRDQLQEEE